MKLERSHKLGIIVAIVIAALIGLMLLMLPTRHVTGSTNQSSGSLPVVSSDGQSVGQSIQGNQLVPAPTSGLQSSGSGTALQPTGEVK